MKLTDILISALIKKGILYEARMCNVQFEVPTEEGKPSIIVHCKIDHMSLALKED